MKNRTLFFGLSVLIAACSSSSDDSGGLGGSPYSGGEGTPASTAPGEGAGTLTAGAWDDNRNYSFFSDYLEGFPGERFFTRAEHDAAHERALASPGSRETLDIALVIDTTGSMGDELAYLQVEFNALTTQISKLYPTADQRWALVVYRDHGDAYVVNEYDFVGDLKSYQTLLTKQGFDGGGDYPEAPDKALEAAVKLSWRAGSTARMLFWVADAPHHEGQAQVIGDAVRTASELDIHVYPVAASGINELTEYTMRSAAQLTLGRYLFLTDDSGIGNSHKEPTIPCYYVTRLDHAILRMVDIEMSGKYHEPSPDQLIRAGGDPKSGVCQLTDGFDVVAF